MAHDLLSQFYSSLNFPLHEKLTELTKIIDQFGPNKELQTLFPELINNIFATSFSNGWGLKTITMESNKYEYETLIRFLHPRGPIFRLCYKLLTDPQLKYPLPLSALPLDLQLTIERGRCPQFYADMLATDPQTMNVTALMLNPFDYYMFNFALHVVNNNQHRISWDNWNSVYFALACDYLLHFLPVDPNEPVLPHIPNYTGKVPMAAPLQTANRPYSPSMLLIQDLSGSMMSNQHTSQTQSRNEVWRSETVLQVFIDIWMSVEQVNGPINDYQRSYQSQAQFSSPERVRTVRVLVKHLHAFSARHISDPAVRSSALRKYARQIMCARAYHYIKHLVTTWPLDASFRLVLELWLSYIQPWRYVDNSIIKDRLSKDYQEDQQTSTSPLDCGFTQFIAENFPSYVCIFQMVLPRFVRLDLSAYKNTVMLFRLGKVFSQPHLVPILKNLEQAIVDSGTGQHSPDTSFNNSGLENYAYNGLSLHKWASIAKQSLSEFNLSANFEYQPLWSESTRQFAIEFVQKIHSAVAAATKNAEEFTRKLNKKNSGLWSGLLNYFMLGGDEDDVLLEEFRKVAPFLNATAHYFTTLFDLNENTLQSEPIAEDLLENSSFANSSTFPQSVTNKLRSTASVRYMGDPDLMPITSYESTILVRMLHQIAARINESYQPQFINLWDKNDFWGYVAREVLQKPCRIQNYVKDVATYQNVVTEELPARLSLRRLGSQAFVVWFIIGYLVFRMFSYSGFHYVFVLVTLWIIYVLINATFKMMKIVRYI